MKNPCKSIVLAFAFVLFIFAICMYKSNLSIGRAHQAFSAVSLESKFTPYIRKVQKDWNVPGVSVAVVKDGSVIYQKGFGYRNEQGDPVTTETIFDIASLTKSFTASMLGIQVDRNMYDWNTKVAQLIPSFQLNNAELTHNYEVKDLLAHNSGLPEGALDGMGDFGYSTTQTLAALKYIKPETEFRQDFAYQDIFLAYAKKIIEKESGSSYADDLHSWLLQPLTMNRTFLRNEKRLKQLDNLAQPYLIDPYFKNHAYSTDSPYLSKEWALDIGLAGGGVHSTAADMAKWLIFNINNGAYKKNRLVEKKSMRFIHSPQTIIEENASGDWMQAYGEGWFIDRASYPSHTMLYHMGGGTGMHALMAYMPNMHLGIVVLTNQYINKVPTVLMRWLFDSYIYGKPIKDWNNYYLSKQKKLNVKSINLLKQGSRCANSHDNLDRYLGGYQNPIYGCLKIEKQNGIYKLTIGPQNVTWRLSACKKNTLKAYWPNPNGMDTLMLWPGQDRLTFRANGKGDIVAMKVSYLASENSKANEFVRSRCEVGGHDI